MMIFLIVLILSDQRSAAAQNDQCQPASCNGQPPFVRFPFRLKGRQPERCGYPGFDLSCRSDNTTALEFQLSVVASARHISFPIATNATVQSIDYKTQVIRIQVLNSSCPPSRVPAASVSTISPFHMHYDGHPFSGPSGFLFTLLNCSDIPDHFSSTRITCLDRGSFHVYAVYSEYSVTQFSMASCLKMYNISGISNAFLSGSSYYNDAELHWSEPSCGNCEEKGMYCGLMSNSTVYQTQCFDKPKPPGKGGVNSKTVAIAMVIPGVFLITLAVAAIHRIHLVKKRKQNDSRTRQFLEDYNAGRPATFKYADVKRITDGFKYILRQGVYGTVYKGKLSNHIFVVVKVLKNSKGTREEFLSEVGTLRKIHHVNVIRLVGYCADGHRRALVYEFFENGSLEKLISSGSHRNKIGWEKMLEIAIGVAKGVDYIHQGCNKRILHLDIKPDNILLDQNLNPKVADFGQAKLCSKEESLVTMTAARGRIGYIAPEVLSRNFGKVPCKSDIFSFGMVLIDMVGGGKSFREDESYFLELTYNHLEEGEDVPIRVEKEGDGRIKKRLMIVGLWCIQWHPADRPSMKVVIKMLEDENMPIMPPNPFSGMTSADPDAVSRGSSQCSISPGCSFSISMNNN